MPTTASSTTEVRGFWSKADVFLKVQDLVDIQATKLPSEIPRGFKVSNWPHPWAEPSKVPDYIDHPITLTRQEHGRTPIEVREEVVFGMREGARVITDLASPSGDLRVRLVRKGRLSQDKADQTAAVYATDHNGQELLYWLGEDGSLEERYVRKNAKLRNRHVEGKRQHTWGNQLLQFAGRLKPRFLRIPFAWLGRVLKGDPKLHRPLPGRLLHSPAH